MKKFLFVLVVSLVYSMAIYAVPSFPGAEGYVSSKGGRGGKVVKVTNLNSSGPGSFRAACELKIPRTIVFEVSGVIKVSSAIKLNGSHVTIAGETAPGDGITIYAPNGQAGGITRWQSEGQGSDMIVRFIRVRGSHLEDAFTVYSFDQIVIDHTSLAWSCDEVLAFTYVSNGTISWTFLGEPKALCNAKGKVHNYGPFWQHGSWTKNGVWHHNLFPHIYVRAPMSNIPNIDIVNNVFYNWSHGGPMYLFQGYSGNIVNNFAKSGPSTYKNKYGPELIKLVGTNSRQNTYVHGNVWDHKGKPFITDQNRLYNEGTGPGQLSSPHQPVAPVKWQTAEEAYESVLKYAGCLPHDSLDRLLIEQTRNRTGEAWDMRNGGTFRYTASQEMTLLTAGLNFKVKAKPDGDNDGIPDWFEDSLGFNKNKADDAYDKDGNGYTNIEEYMHYCAAKRLGPSLTSIKMKPPVTGEKGNASVSYTVPGLSRVRIDIYDLNGKNVRNLVNGKVGAGTYELNWDGKGDSGRKLAPGVYLSRINVGKNSYTRKIMLLK